MSTTVPSDPMHPEGGDGAPSSEAAKVEGRRGRRGLIVALVLLAVATLGVGAYLLLAGNEDGPGEISPIADVETRIDFELAPVRAISTTGKKSGQLTRAAEEAARGAVKTLDALYTFAFLDDENWREGSYEEIFEVFEKQTAAAARGDLRALTLGADAGERFVDVQPESGHVAFRVLMDQRNRPDTVVAIVSFKANAEGTDGQTTLVQSSGQFFLQKTNGTWTILSYSVVRDDQILQPQPGPSGTASSSGSAPAASASASPEPSS